MNNNLSSDEIEKICQILHSNQNKINLLRNDLSNNTDKKNTKTKTTQFLDGLEIDIKNILLLLERIKINLNNKSQNGNYKTYCINDDKNMLQDVIICGCCECCKCNKCCNCSTNDCSEIQQLNIPNNNPNQKDNEYIKESINDEDDKRNQFLNNRTFSNSPYLSSKPISPYSNINNTYPNLNMDNNNIRRPDFNNNNNIIDFNNFDNDNNNNNINNLLNPNNQQNFGFNNNINNNEGKIIYSTFPSFSPPKTNNYENDFHKPFGYIKKQNYNNNADNEDKNSPMEDIIKNSAIIKSKRFHPSKSYDNMEIESSPRVNKARIINTKNKDNKYNDLFNNQNYNNMFNNNNNNDNNNIYINDNNNNRDDEKNNLGQKKKKMEKMNKIQMFLSKLYKQPEEITNRFKKIYGDDIEEKLLKGDIENSHLTEMDNILNKIINMSIWGEDDKKKKRSRDNNSYDKNDVKRKHRFVYNPIQEKIKLMKALKNNQAYYREFPRGWYSTKEYFINNGTDINNENVNKYV